MKKLSELKFTFSPSSKHTTCFYKIQRFSCTSNRPFKSASKSNDLVAHEKNCFKGRRYACTFEGGCNCTFSQKSLMHQHLKAVHFDDPFKCDFCTHTFMYKKSLDSHLNQHHKQKEKDKFKYRCSECDKAMDDLTEFKVHMNRHQDIKPYKCNICNQKCFYSQSQLTDHLKRCRSLPELKYECSVCGKKFSQEDHYREHFKAQHVDTVKGESPTVRRA